MVLFHLSNAAMLPLALNELSKRVGQSGFVVSAAIIVPQIVVVACSPWAGRLAQRIGRKPILLAGFAALPLRALLFIASPDAVPLVVIEVLDGISATVFGLTMPLIAADLTHGPAISIWRSARWVWPPAWAPPPAPLSPAGWPTSSVAPVAFFGLAMAGLAALAMVWR